MHYAVCEGTITMYQYYHGYISQWTTLTIIEERKKDASLSFSVLEDWLLFKLHLGLHGECNLNPTPTPFLLQKQGTWSEVIESCRKVC